jgi:hypothetical protein
VLNRLESVGVGSSLAKGRVVAVCHKEVTTETRALRQVSGRRVGLARLTRRRRARTGCPNSRARRRILARGFGGRHAPMMSPRQLKEAIQVAHVIVGSVASEGRLVGGEVHPGVNSRKGFLRTLSSTTGG